MSDEVKLVYGIRFEQGFVFPWDTSEYEDFEEWYIYEVCEFKPISSIPDEIKAEYIKYLGENLPPIYQVNYSSRGDPIFILALAKYTYDAWWAHPKEITFDSLVVDTQDEYILRNFCVIHKIKFNTPPKWYLIQSDEY